MTAGPGDLCYVLRVPSRRIESIKVTQDTVGWFILVQKNVRLFKELLRQYGKEFRRILCAVAIDQPVVSAAAIINKLIEHRSEHRHPAFVLFACSQRRSTVADATIHHVQL